MFARRIRRSLKTWDVPITQKSQLVAISAEPGAPQATVRKPTQGLTSHRLSWASPPRERGTDHRPQRTVYHVVGFSSTPKCKKNYFDNIAPCIRG